MNVDQCWMTYCIHYATGEGVHYVVSIAPTAERAARLFEERADDFFRGNSTTAPLAEALENYPRLHAAIPEEVLQRTVDASCWTLEYFGTIDFNCS